LVAKVLDFYLCSVKKKISYSVLSLLLVLIFISIYRDALAQCSMCKKIVTDGTTKKEVGNTINYAILYLMAIPYFALGFIFRKQIGSLIRQFRST